MKFYTFPTIPDCLSSIIYIIKLLDNVNFIFVNLFLNKCREIEPLQINPVLNTEQ